MTTCSARVQITIDVDAGSTWGKDCQLDQVYRQAAQESVARIRDVLQKSNVRVTVVGEPKVTAVLISDK